MAGQQIKQPSIFGRLGTGIGKGLGEQIPKEIERNRLASGLKNLGEQQGLDPYQQFAGLAGVAHEYPQIVQSGGELLRQRGIGQGLRNVANQQQNNVSNQKEGNPIRDAITKQNAPESKASPGLQPTPSGLVSPTATQATIQGYVPKTRDQILSRAADMYDQNRELYPNPESAIQAATQEDAQNQAINNAQQANRNSQIGVEDRARTQLQKLRESANTQIPDNVFQQVENDVLDKIKDGEPELEAAKYGQKTLDGISREYKQLDSMGNWRMVSESPRNNLQAIRTLRKEFKKRDDLENFADQLIGRNGLSPDKAYYLAYPVSDNKELNNELLKVKSRFRGEEYIPFIGGEKPEKTFEKIANKMGKNDSPLSIGEELKYRGYDPSDWIKYLDENTEKFGLSPRQIRELSKPTDFLPKMNDLWLFSLTGLDPLKEIK
jgi:hypothetical protein